jgi:hypothetical protein
MPIILSNRDSVETGLFCRIDVQQYRNSSSGAFSQQVLTFSDYYRTVEIAGETYLPFGNLLQIGSLNAELKASAAPLTVSVSGIPNTSLKDIIHSRIKGSEIRIYRGLFDAETGAIISGIGANPVGRFTGFISNYSLTEEWDSATRTAYSTVDFYCQSNIDFLGSITRGRKTNPESYTALYPNDPSFDRIPNLQQNIFNFGGPKE